VCIHHWRATRANVDPVPVHIPLQRRARLVAIRRGIRSRNRFGSWSERVVQCGVAASRSVRPVHITGRTTVSLPLGVSNSIPACGHSVVDAAGTLAK
jgi:hypothetical protein